MRCQMRSADAGLNCPMYRTISAKSVLAASRQMIVPSGRFFGRVLLVKAGH